MIELEVLNRIRHGICAVGYLTVPLEKYNEDPTRPYFKVVGTGFLVRSTTVMTNRHVIKRLEELQAELGFPHAQRMLLFVTADERGRLRAVTRMIRGALTANNSGLDIGFIEFQRHPEPHFMGIDPLVFEERYSLNVTEEIAVCGYPYGEAMLQRDGKVYRWGPVIQQGYVSGVSPFDAVPEGYLPNELLLDVRIAGGMSGGPIVRPRDGRVVGIVHSTWEATTALGLPLTTSVIDGWLSQYSAVASTR
jgi:S1-C subfamily serine protease